jgi:hypothetical protein
MQSSQDATQVAHKKQNLVSWLNSYFKCQYCHLILEYISIITRCCFRHFQNSIKNVSFGSVYSNILYQFFLLSDSIVVFNDIRAVSVIFNMLVKIVHTNSEPGFRV